MWLGRVSAIRSAGSRGEDASDSIKGVWSDCRARGRRTHHVKESRSIRGRGWEGHGTTDERREAHARCEPCAWG